MGIFSNLYDVIELGHFNWPFRNSHPVHPATVHFPLTFLSTAYTVDTLYGLASHYGASSAVFGRVVPFLPQISQLAFLSHALGVVTALPSMTSGMAEFWELYKSKGINHTDKRLTNPGKSGDHVIDSSIKVGAVHGLLNAAAFGYSGYVVLSRWRIAGFTPTRAQIWLSAMMVPGVALSAALGGELVYGKGVGVQRMGGALDEKKAGYEEYSQKSAQKKS